MRPSYFKKEVTFFHLNIHFQTTGYFKNLDWIYLQRLIHSLAMTHAIEVQALVMMDTHLHLLFQSMNKNENFFCNEVANQLRNSNSLGPEEKPFCEPIKNLAQYLAVYKYIYNNPVEAQICKTADHYPYSSLQILLGRCSGHCLISDKLGLIQNPQQILKWLNSETSFKISKLNLQKEMNH